MTDQTPATAAGRALLHRLVGLQRDYYRLADDILAIEAEAGSAAPPSSPPSAEAALPPGWCGHGWISEEEHERQSSAGTHLFDPMCGYCASYQLANDEATIAHLRKIEEAARAAVKDAQPDDDFDGQFVEYLVTHNVLDALRAALSDLDHD